MRKYSKHLLTLTILSIIGLFIFNNNNISANSTNIKIYDLKSVKAAGTIPDFTWEVDGKQVSFKEFTKNKVVFLNIWATWCPPCRREMPDIVKISKELSSKDFVVIGISVDQGSTARAKVESFAKAQGVEYINILDVDKKIKSLIGIGAYPTTFILDKKGQVSQKIVGMQTYSVFMRAINRAI